MSPGVRLDARESNVTYLPSAEISRSAELEFHITPDEFCDMSVDIYTPTPSPQYSSCAPQDAPLPPYCPRQDHDH